MKKYYIGELIKKRRKKLHLTQEQLAEGIDRCVAVFSAACRKNGQAQYAIADGEEQSQ